MENKPLSQYISSLKSFCLEAQQTADQLTGILWNGPSACYKQISDAKCFPSFPISKHNMASPPRFAYLDLENSQNQNNTNTKAKSNNEIPAGASSFMEVLTPTTFSLALESNAGIDCFGNERHALANQAKFFNNQLLSDITLVVVKKKYFCHKLILVKSSDVFERMFSSDWDKSQRKEIELQEDSMCATVFPRFLKFLYSCHVRLNIGNTLSMLILSDKYNVEDLRNVCINFACTCIIPRLQLKDVFHIWFQYATKCYHKKLVQACVQALSEKMDDIMMSVEWEQEWLTIERDQLIEFLKSSELTIKDEYELWEAVLKWLLSTEHPTRAENLRSNVKTVIEHIRFPMMTPDQLCQVENCKVVLEMPDIFQPFLMQAYKYHALPLTSRAMIKEFTSASFLLRNYTDLRWDKRVVIQRYTECQKCAEVSFRFATRASTFPAQTWEWELKLHPKGFSSTCDDFRAVLYSNLILDQPRPVEYLLSLVDREKILHSVSGKKNFSKTRYTTDTEMDKKISLSDLSQPNCPLLIDDNLVLQIVLRPVG
ncbi:BTB/POZ domain-containing protein 17-like isoform X3 [Octopus sinensis]|uniref:BTB/POZ domain-containing protein 17-like isoform X3 n=1 Tax=Octopus sinensis TaxID=2607531 RepID=A0A7E6EV91_9MOLL|nr:BTB/POZ domain-containing protein 17-like isoform X3 [Octopus sinensis]